MGNGTGDGAVSVQFGAVSVKKRSHKDEKRSRFPEKDLRGPGLCICLWGGYVCSGKGSIVLGLFLAPEHPEGSLGQSQQLVLAGIDGDGGDPLHHIL